QLLPDHGAQTAPNPLIQSVQHRGRLAVAEVAFPTTQVVGEVLRHLFQTDALRPGRKFPHSLLTAEQSLRRDPPFYFGSSREAKAQKLSLLRSRHRARSLIHLECEHAVY